MDEFLLAMPALALEEANGFARRIHERLGLPMTVSGVTLQANSSIGMALLPEHASTAEELLINAGLAVRQAKEEGGNCVVSFSAALNARHERQNVIEAGLRESLLQDGLGLWLAYQPQLNLRNGRVAAVGAGLQLRLFGKPEIDGSRRLGVTLAIADNVEDAVARAKAAASAVLVAG